MPMMVKATGPGARPDEFQALADVVVNGDLLGAGRSGCVRMASKRRSTVEGTCRHEGEGAAIPDCTNQRRRQHGTQSLAILNCTEFSARAGSVRRVEPDWARLKGRLGR